MTSSATPPVPATPASAAAWRPLSWRAEAGRQLTRRRTLWYGVLLLVLPLILVGAFALGDPPSATGTRLVDLARHGSANFTVFTLSAAADFLLVILAAQLVGDPVPSEASWSSLRYLLTAPVPRARLLTSKLVVALGMTATAVVALPAWSLLVGGVAYGWEGFATTSGVAMSWSDFLPRLALAVGYLVISLLTVAGFAFLFGVLTDAPLAAVGGAVIVTVVSQILRQVEQLGDLRDALPMYYGRAWFQALAPEIGWQDLQRGALWSVLTFTLCVGGAFLVFRRKDVLS